MVSFLSGIIIMTAARCTMSFVSFGDGFMVHCVEAIMGMNDGAVLRYKWERGLLLTDCACSADQKQER